MRIYMYIYLWKFSYFSNFWLLSLSVRSNLNGTFQCTHFSKLKKVEFFKSVVYTKEKSRKQMGEAKWNKGCYLQYVALLFLVHLLLLGWLIRQSILLIKRRRECVRASVRRGPETQVLRARFRDLDGQNLFYLFYFILFFRPP